LELEQISKLPFGGFLQVPLSLSLKPGKSAAPSPRHPATHHLVHLWLIFVQGNDKLKHIEHSEIGSLDLFTQLSYIFAAQILVCALSCPY